MRKPWIKTPKITANFSELAKIFLKFIANEFDNFIKFDIIIKKI